MPIRPGRSGTKSCLSLASVLKSRRGMARRAKRPRRARRRRRLMPPWQGGPAAGRGRPRGDATSPQKTLSAVEDGLQVQLDLVLIDALGERQLLDEEVARRVEHLALAEAQVLVELEQVQVAQHLRDLEHGAGLDLLHILAIAAVAGGGGEPKGFFFFDGLEIYTVLFFHSAAPAH